MMIQLPSGGKLNLDESLKLEEKIVIVEVLLDQWSTVIDSNWDNVSVKFFLDGLANYIVWHKELDKKNTEDKDVMSIRKIEEMVGRRRGRSTPFSSMSQIQKENTGL